MKRQVTESENIQAGMDTLKGSLYVTMGGSIVKYYPATRTADVQPMQNDPRVDPETGQSFFEPWDVLQQVPVAWPRFSGGTGKASFTLAGMLNPNDQVVLASFDLDTSTWIAGGRSGKPVDPAHIRRLGGNHWRVLVEDFVSPIVGLSNSSPEPGTNCLFLIGPDGSQQQIRFNTDGTIQLGGTGGDFAALAGLVHGELTKIKNALAAATAPSGGGPVTYGGSGYTSVGNVASALIKAQ
jgi:hypothetical protein